MEPGVIERGGGMGGDCGCGAGGSLAVLQEVQRAYEDRLARVLKMGGASVQQQQIKVLQSWVADVVAQNTLLVQTVEELEKEITARLLTERARHNEEDKVEKNCQCDELQMANDALKHDNLEKEREIRRLVEEANNYQQKIEALASDMTSMKNTPHEKPKRDTASNTDFTGERKEVAVESVSYGRVLHQEATKCQARIDELELTLKSSTDNVRALRKVNVALSEELHALRRVCAALDEQCRAATLRSHFKDDIIREMRRQLKQAKSKIRECESHNNSLRPLEESQRLHTSMHTYGSVKTAVGSQRVRRRRSRNDAPLHPDSEDDHSSRFTGSGDDGHQEGL